MNKIYGYKMCPFCGGNVDYAGISSGHIFPDINTGQMYLCRECGYQGSFIIELENPEDVKKMKEYLMTNRINIEPQSFSFPEKWRTFWKWIAVIFAAGVIFAIFIAFI